MSQPLSPQALVYDLRAANDPQIAPGGASVLYSLSAADATTKQLSSELWLCDIDGDNARQVTRSGGRNGGARWSPDGRWIAFTSDRPGQEQTGIFVLPADGAGEARELTRHRQSISDLAWSPDGAQLAYITLVDPANPNEEARSEAVAPVRVTRRVDYKQDGRGYLGDQRLQLFVVAVASGERQQLTREPVDHHFPQWSPDGRQLAVQLPNRNGIHSQLALIAAKTGKSTLVGPADGAIGTWAWSPSGDRIIFTGDPEATPQHDFFLYDVASTALRRLTDDLPSLPVAGMPGVAPPSQPVWLDDRRVLFHSIQAGASGLEIIDTETGAIELVERWQALHVGISVDLACRSVVQARATLTSSGEIAVYNLRTRETTTIVDPNVTLLSARPAASWERFEVQRGDFTIEAWLLKPPGFDPRERYPLILDVHGGPAAFYGYGFTPLQQCLATNGFLVVYANPRGSTSYGRRFALAVHGDWGGQDYQDLLAVVDTALERPYADPERTGIVGYSYGGYVTAWTITQTARFKAAVCGAPVFDMESSGAPATSATLATGGNGAAHPGRTGPSTTPARRRTSSSRSPPRP